MTTQEVTAITGYKKSTVIKWANDLGVKYYGAGNHKVFDWKKSDVERLRRSAGTPRNRKVE